MSESLIQLRLLGPIVVRLGGEEPPRELLWRKNVALLVYLARSPGLRRSREHLVGLLWGESPEPAARHSLNEALRVLRKSGGEALVSSVGDQVVLGGDLVELDLEQFESLVREDRWAEAARLVRGPYLQGFTVPECSAFEDWVYAERTQWNDLAVRALVESGRSLLTAGETSKALEAASRALTVNPFSDAAIRMLMKAAALADDAAAALARYEAFARRVDEELGVEPQPETRELAERIRSERSFSRPPGIPEPDLRARRPALVGRSRELAAMLVALRRGFDSRRATAVVLEGEEGAGKTRLAEEATSRGRLNGAAIARVRSVPGDAEQPGAGLEGLLAGGLADAAAELEAGAAGAAGAAGGDGSPYDRVLALARAVTGTRPLVLWADDAHHLDPESAEALPRLLRDLERRPLALITALAPVPHRPELDELRSRVGRDLPGVSMPLSPLDRAAIEELAAAILPDQDRESLARITRRVEADSAGLPLFAVELLNGVRLGLEIEGMPSWPRPFETMDQTYPGDLPDSIVAAIRVGFRRLSADAQAVLQAASVVAQRPDAGLLARVTGLPADRLTDALDELEWNRWLSGEGRGYSFVAGIVRDVVSRDMLTPGQRRRLLEAAQSG